MNWIIHDSFKLEKDAEEQGENIVTLKLAKGIKVVKNKNSKRPFELYILPLDKKGK